MQGCARPAQREWHVEARGYTPSHAPATGRSEGRVAVMRRPVGSVARLPRRSAQSPAPLPIRRVRSTVASESGDLRRPDPWSQWTGIAARRAGRSRSASARRAPWPGTSTALAPAFRTRLERDREADRLVVADAGDDLRRRVTMKRTPTGDHFVGDRAERKDVGPRIHGVASELLGRAVRRRGHHPGSVIAAPVSRGVPEVQQLDAYAVSITLAGLMSRWTMPRRCALSSASTIWVQNSIACPSGSAPRVRRCWSVSPSRCSMTM